MVALIFYGLNLVLNFFSRRIFIEYLGTEILGLNTTATNLLQFLNLAELGIGAAIGFTLYKPLATGNKNSINEILTLQGWYYKRIAWFVIAGSAVLMLFFPLIFAKSALPLWYAYASYSVILLSALLSYFFNYKQVLLSADQQDYKIQYSYKAVMLIKIALQTVAIRYLPHPYILWLVLEALFAIIATITLNRTINKSFPYLEKVKASVRELKERHQELTIRIKQVFYHKIGGFALTQTSPLIIYAYANLTLVSIYGNYIIVVMAITSLMASIFNSINGGIGNLVASGDQKSILRVFNELFSIRFLIITTMCVAFYILSPTIVFYWIGKQYILGSLTVFIITMNMFISLNRSTVDNYISSYGLYGDIFSPLIEAILNIGLSILLGYFWDLNGILLGVFISQFLIIFCWKPYYLFTRALLEPFYKYLNTISKNLASALGGLIVVYLISQNVKYTYYTTYNEILFHLAIVAIYFLMCLVIQVVLKTGVSGFYNRIKFILKR